LREVDVGQRDLLLQARDVHAVVSRFHGGLRCGQRLVRERTQVRTAFVRGVSHAVEREVADNGKYPNAGHHRSTGAEA
jgi:hypothetical protein